MNKRSYKKSAKWLKDWSEERGIEIGAAEIALGSSLIAYAVSSGSLEVGEDYVLTKWGDGRTSDKIVGKAGEILGSSTTVFVAKATLVSIGVASGGTLGVPALIALQGAGALGGLLGKYASEKTWSTLNPPPDLMDVIKAGAPLAIGTALLIDGCRRLIKDKRTLKGLSAVRDGTLHLAKTSTGIVASNSKEFAKLTKTFYKKNSNGIHTTGTAIGLGAVGASIGSAVATSSVTFMGSSTLGAAALSLGLATAPILPVALGGAAGLCIGVTVWKGAKKLQFKPRFRPSQKTKQALTSIDMLESANNATILELTKLGFYDEYTERTEVYWVYGSRAYGYHNFGGDGAICIPWISLSKLLDLYRGKQNSLRDVLRHEYGHAVADTHRGLIRSRKFSLTFGASHDSDDKWEFDPYFHVTEYAAKSASEDFAEVFYLFVKHKGKLPARYDTPAIRAKWEFVDKLRRAIKAGKRRW